jgi:hypothetical protein
LQKIQVANNGFFCKASAVHHVLLILQRDLEELQKDMGLWQKKICASNERFIKDVQRRKQASQRATL